MKSDLLPVVQGLGQNSESVEISSKYAICTLHYVRNVMSLIKSLPTYARYKFFKERMEYESDKNNSVQVYANPLK